MPLDGMDGVMKGMNVSNATVGCGLMNTDKKMYMGRARAGVVGHGVNDKQAIESYGACLKEINP